MREFETYSKLSFLKQYDSNEYIKRFVVTEDDPVADFFQDNESNRVNVLPHDRSKLQKFIAMHLPHNNTGLFYSSFQDKSVQSYSRVTRSILKLWVKPSKELNAVYETESSNCAAWVFPYRAFDFRAVGLSKKDPKHLTMAFENKRFKDGIQGRN